MEKLIQKLVDKYAELQVMVCPDKYKAVVHTYLGEECKCCGAEIKKGQYVQGFGDTPLKAVKSLIKELKTL